MLPRGQMVKPENVSWNEICDICFFETKFLSQLILPTIHIQDHTHPHCALLPPKVSPNKGAPSLPHMGRAFTDCQEMKQVLEFNWIKIMWMTLGVNRPNMIMFGVMFPNQGSCGHKLHPQGHGKLACSHCENGGNRWYERLWLWCVNTPYYSPWKEWYEKFWTHSKNMRLIC